MTPHFSLLAVVVPSSWGALEEKAWLVVVLIASLALISFALHGYCRSIQHRVDQIAAGLFEPPKVKLDFTSGASPPLPSKETSTAVLFLDGYDPVGLEALVSIGRMFRGAFPQVILASARAFDAEDEEGRAEGQALRRTIERALERYYAIADLLDMGLAGRRVAIGTNLLALKVGLAKELAREWPHLVFFSPRLVLEPARWYHHFLESKESRQITRRLQEAGLVAVDLPIRATVRTARSTPRTFCRA